MSNWPACLPNGNTFIAESDSGRLSEIAPASEIVCQFLNPDPTKNGDRTPLHRAIRYSKEEVNKLLSPPR